MEPQTEIVTVQLEDGTTVKVKASTLGGDEDVVVHVGSTPTPERGRTNIVKLSYV